MMSQDQTLTEGKQMISIPNTYHNSEWRNVARLDTGHWFSKSSMRFFGSRISWASIRKTEDGYLFVSSEYKGFSQTERAYTLRKVTLDGNVHTLGAFNEYPTLALAKKALAKLV